MLLRTVTFGIASLTLLACSGQTSGSATGSTQSAVSGDDPANAAGAASSVESLVGLKICDPSACGDLPAPPVKGGEPGTDDGPKPPHGGPVPPPGAPGGPANAQDNADAPPDAQGGGAPVGGPEGPRPPKPSGEGKGGGPGGPGGPGMCGFGPPPVLCVEVSTGTCAWKPLPPPPRGPKGEKGENGGGNGNDDGAPKPPRPQAPPPAPAGGDAPANDSK